MSLSTNKKVWTILLMLFVLLSALITTLFYFKDIFIIILIGGVIILITEKSNKKFQAIIDKFKIHENKNLKTIFIVATIIIWLVILYVLISFTVKDINKTVSFLEQTNVTVKQIYLDKAEMFLGKEMLSLVEANDVIGTIQGFITKTLLELVSGIAIFIGEAVIIIPLMFSFYFKNKAKFKEKIKDVIPSKYSAGILRIINDSSKKLKGYAYAKFVESTIIAIICAIGFYIAGLKGWLLFGIMCGILNIIPYIGPWLGAVAPILVSLLEPTTSTFIITAITMIIAQSIDGYYLIPFLIPKQVNIQPIVAIIIILIGAKLFGALGMLMAIPIYAVYVVVLSGAYKELIKIYNQKTHLKRKKYRNVTEK
jgi:predicted PurR-regulated permease PerM